MHHSAIEGAGDRGHRPVMLDEVLAALAVRADGDYLDGTFGGGGYSRAILGVPPRRLVGLDRDPAAVARGQALAREHPEFTMLEGRFGQMAEHLALIDIDQLDGIVLDIGVSSQQIDDPERGFSFAADGPLDMRMAADGESAADVVNGADEKTLASIIYRYGEERASRRIAKAIVERRGEAPITRTGELASIVQSVLGRSGKIDPATRTFQALRIYVNDELGELERALAAAEMLLRPGGRLVVVAFHSLEDRIVKQFLTARSGRTANPSRHLPERPASRAAAASFRPLIRRPITPGDDEIRINPRARSARLRAAERLPSVAEPLPSLEGRHEC
ncbi:MAG: 16S rRNA (cytosine(1402)-N(4))-methyltransferase RsmH [Alphaproteobacteria bacterium]|nr:16S rRNA (cytosine(1402)-N(4))-methyltransferase RsmH [Alphaproteobacteria bacterium]